jgi:hypothetical protein
MAWWPTWVATMVRGNVGNPDLAADVQDVSDRVLGASVATLGAVLVAVAAVLAIRVVRLVNRLQMSRPWTPWWATDSSTAPQLWPAQHLQQIQGASVTTPYGQGPQQPYGQQPYGAPQTGYPAAPGGMKPNNYLAWSIISIFLFWPLGIAAIINATKVDPAWQMGNAPMAQEQSNKAKKFSMIGTLIRSGLVGHLVHHRVEVWIVAIWQRIASSTGVSSPTWPSSLKSVQTVPATHCGERSLSRQTTRWFGSARHCYHPRVSRTIAVRPTSVALVEPAATSREPVPRAAEPLRTCPFDTAAGTRSQHLHES